MRNMKKAGLLAGILTFAAVSFITFGLTGNTAKALEKGESFTDRGVVYEVVKMPEGEKPGQPLHHLQRDGDPPAGSP